MNPRGWARVLTVSLAAATAAAILLHPLFRP